MKFKLETQHFIDGRLLDAGEVIGDGTSVILPEGFKPSRGMTPLDAEAEEAMEQVRPFQEDPVDGLAKMVSAPAHSSPSGSDNRVPRTDLRAGGASPADGAVPEPHLDPDIKNPNDEIAPTDKNDGDEGTGFESPTVGGQAPPSASRPGDVTRGLGLGEPRRKK